MKRKVGNMDLVKFNKKKYDDNYPHPIFEKNKKLFSSSKALSSLPPEEIF